MEQLVAKYLANDLEENERLAFERQLVEDDALQNELKAQLDLLYLIEKPQQQFNANAAWEKVAPQLKQKQAKVVHMPSKPKYSFMKIAATLLIVLTAGYFVNDYIAKDGGATVSDETIFYTTTKGIKDVVLPDGTAVKLNANSTLTLAKDFGKGNRNVTLTGGANFDVKKNPELPFIIDASTGVIEVLGTSFDLEAYEGKEVELNVTEGRVKFGHKAKKETEEVFTAGERAVLATDGSKLTREKVKNKNYSAWWTKRLEFDNAPFKEVFKDIEKAYNVTIEYSEAMENCRYNAVLENYNLQEFLETFQQTNLNITSVTTKDSHIKLEGFACNN
ncbi:FecR family protein [Roseivirga pacifica]|uniref:FecR family protein n=1 Tax=Roseivirga pacifica TaxID=1267423 RepID=UPI00227CD2FB|nr:FecR family protein [Roseivirga pacifica]